MNKPEFLSDLVTRELVGSRWAQLAEPFIYYSAVLGRTLFVPTGFICDYESVPLLKSYSKRAGVLHDYLGRTDSDPVVSKQAAADVYAEAQQLRDHLCATGWGYLAWRAVLCAIKTTVVRIWPGYYHRHKVAATLADLTGHSAAIEATE